MTFSSSSAWELQEPLIRSCFYPTNDRFSLEMYVQLIPGLNNSILPKTGLQASLIHEPVHKSAMPRGPAFTMATITPKHPKWLRFLSGIRWLLFWSCALLLPLPLPGEFTVHP